MVSEVNIYTDGGSRSNPGPAAAAFYIFSPSKQILAQGGKFLGQKTNNEAEYQGVLLALEALAELPLSPVVKVTFFSDSQLIVNQLKGAYKIKEPRLAVLASQIHSKLNSLSLSPLFVAIPRSQNSLADALVNRILDHTPSIS